jgi:hypothetical protein
MKLAVIGSRTLIDEKVVFDQLNNLLPQIECIISGGAPGIDTIAVKWAKINNVPTVIHLPDWTKFGKSAGLKRNLLIVTDCTECLAFWDGISKGTENSINICHRLRKPVNIILVHKVENDVNQNLNLRT